MKKECHRALWHALSAGLTALLMSAPGHAQLGIQVPNVPTVNVPGALNNVTQQVQSTAGNALTAGNAQVQTGLRAARVRELLRSNRDLLEADPSGAPLLRGQLMGLAPDAETLTRITAAGFTVIEQTPLDALGLQYVVFTAPAGMSTRRALRRLRALDPAGSYDYHHLYLESGTAAGETAPQASSSTGPKANGVRLGLIDGGVAGTHPVFQSTSLHRWGCDGAEIPSAHGTAVASLMVGQSSEFHGAAAGAELYAADIYCGRPSGGALRDLAGAFAWLAQQQVPVVNVSLVGPANVVLEQLVRSMAARGHLIVAAVGNDGPASKPLYPAAYPQVIGVTAVDARDRVLVEAVRGQQVDFAAPGADIAAADAASGYAAVRGTSFAAPIVAGLLALHLHTANLADAEQATSRLSAQAIDLGSRGLDRIYGNGLVGTDVRDSLTRLFAKVSGPSTRH